MLNVLRIFRSRPTIDRPPIGRLVYREGVWETKTPPPPLDSRGVLGFRAGADGPSAGQLDAFRALAASYAGLLPSVLSAMFREYQALQQNGWELLPAASADAMTAVTRLGTAMIEPDQSVFLGYDLYFYHEPSQSLELLDHRLSVVVRDGQVVDVLFEG